MSPIESIGSIGFSEAHSLRDALGTLPRDPGDASVDASQIVDILRRSEGAVLFINHQDESWAENLEAELKKKLTDILGSGTTLYTLRETSPYNKTSHLVYFSLSPLPQLTM